MNYFQPYSPAVDETILAAWDSQIAETAEMPWLAKALATRSADVFPRFAACYAQLRALPRGARRAFQRQLARSVEPTAVPPEWRRKLAASLAGAALLLALGQSAAQANTIMVNTNKPGINAGDMLCSLIEAIQNANDTATGLVHSDCAAGDPAGADEIVLPAATTHTLTNIYDNTYGPTLLPAITSQITIEGNGSKITRKKSKSISRLMAVTSTGDLTLENVTLSGGLHNYGGAIFNYGTLTITDSTISGNKAVKGGGIANGAGAALTIDHSTLTKNAAIYGGGLFDYRGTVTVENTTITGNTTHYGGAGAYEHQGTLIVQNSTITSNKGSRAGGIYIQGGILEIDNTVISKNSASEHGGGVMSSNNRSSLPPPCSVTIENSTISTNAAHYDGGGMLNFGCTLIVRNSTVVANKSGTGAGGISSGAAPSTIENSTLSGNSGRYAGGIYGSSIDISNSTITGNKSRFVGGAYNLGQMTLIRTLISGNKGALAAEAASRSSGTMTVNNFNLFGLNGNAGVVGFTPGATDIVPGAGVAISNILAPLANNGGPTQTHALVPGSPALDVVPILDCPTTDQRGTLRPQGPLCDIGAFEK